MNDSIIQWLENHPDAEWDSNGTGLTEAEINSYMAGLGFNLPDDLKEIYIHLKNISVLGETQSFELYSLSEAVDLSEEPDNMLYIPGMFIIAGDGGGNFYYADPNNILGRGAFAVYHSSMGALSYGYSVYVGNSVSDVIKKIVAGISYEDLPYLQNECEVPHIKKMPSTPVINNMEELLKHLPPTINHPAYGKGVLEIKESTKNDGSLHVSGGYAMEDDNILYYTFGGKHQGLYDAMAPYLFIKGLLN